jgi:transposase
MIQLTPHIKILVAIEPADFRNGIDGLAAVCREKLAQDPFSGILFVFRNRRGTAIKLLCYDGSGFWLLQKRFSEGRLRWWPKTESEPLSTLAAKQLQILIYNGDPSTVQFAEDWRKLSL